MTQGQRESKKNKLQHTHKVCENGIGTFKLQMQQYITIGLSFYNLCHSHARTINLLFFHIKYRIRLYHLKEKLLKKRMNHKSNWKLINGHMDCYFSFVPQCRLKCMHIFIQYNANLSFLSRFEGEQIMRCEIGYKMELLFFPRSL